MIKRKVNQSVDKKFIPTVTIVTVWSKQKPNTHREYCGRPGKGQLGLLGNPFWMKDESQRDKCCDKYEEWFNSNIPQRAKELIEIAKTQEIELACFCQSPKDVVKKRCHCETIKKFILKELEMIMKDLNDNKTKDMFEEEPLTKEELMKRREQELLQVPAYNRNNTTFQDLMKG